MMATTSSPKRPQLVEPNLAKIQAASTRHAAACKAVYAGSIPTRALARSSRALRYSITPRDS